MRTLKLFLLLVAVLSVCAGADCEFEDISLGGFSHGHGGGYYYEPVYYYEPAPVYYDYGYDYYDPYYYDYGYYYKKIK